MDISVIIPTYNRREILKKCLELLAKQTYPPDKFEVIIVDDNSTDGTAEMVRNFKAPFAANFILQDKNNGGPAANNNLGMKNARGKYVLFMNSDIFVPHNFVSEHMKFHRQYPGIIVQGPAINTSNFNNPFEETKGYTGYSNIQMGYFITWNCSIEKALVEKAGLFDESFKPMSWEDVELGYRLKKLKVKQKFNPAALGFHYRAPFTLADLDGIRQKSIIMGRNGVRYWRKHKSFFAMIAAGAWPGMLWFNKLRGLIAHLIGKKSIYRLYQWLLDHKWQKTLALVVGWSGKYWYMLGVEEAMKEKR